MEATRKWRRQPDRRRGFIHWKCPPNSIAVQLNCPRKHAAQNSRCEFAQKWCHFPEEAKPALVGSEKSHPCAYSSDSRRAYIGDGCPVRSAYRLTPHPLSFLGRGPTRPWHESVSEALGGRVRLLPVFPLAAARQRRSRRSTFALPAELPPRCDGWSYLRRHSRSEAPSYPNSRSLGGPVRQSSRHKEPCCSWDQLAPG